MKDYLENFLSNLNLRYKTGISREHSYRGDLQNLLMEMVPGILVTNEPARVACGAPDYIITKGGIPVGYIEAKDIGKDLSSKDYKEQFGRYKQSLPNLIITDYLDFWLFRNGKFATSVKVGGIKNGKIRALKENFEKFNDLVVDFCSYSGQTIDSPIKLSKMMAAKARMLATVIENALISDEKEDGNLFYEDANNTLRDQLAAFKQILIHDITPKGFADIYAQTIAYGMFAARLHDPTIEDFSRQEAAELIPKSNPFLRKLFQYIAGYDLDDRIKWIVDDLADVFRATDVAALLKNFGKATQQNDPIIHFYETFLSEYDPRLRKSRGVWYTPEPVVNFIVRAVDDILKSEFGLSRGLADTSKTTIKINTQIQDKRSSTGYKQQEVDVHEVQILDPACGTGTFLADIIKHIYKNFEGQEGIWSQYVENHLIPRLNGFEILMASYAMAHLKLELLFKETGYKSTRDQRLKVFLTNSLEEHHPDTGTLFASWLSSEASEANHIKRDTPVMVVLGNPPYSGESSNKGEWIMKLMEDYKKEPGGEQKLQERNPKWINDDYVKFLRYGQYYIEKNGEGILAFINPHGFLDNPTFRGMRWNLLKTYDKIYTIDLHGNSKKKEVCPDGSPDVNVFDIMQGVSINLFVKTGKKKTNELGKVFHYDLYGKREEKYNFLWGNNIKSVPYAELPNVKPNYFFVQKDFEVQKQYGKGFSINEIMIKNSSGIATARDGLTIQFSEKEIQNIVNDFSRIEIEEARKKYNLRQDVRDWKVSLAKADVLDNLDDRTKFTQILYRPFDLRYTFYTGKTKGFHCMPRREIMNNIFNKNNIGFIFPRQCKGESGFNHGFVSKRIIDVASGDAHSGSGTNFFPLYLYHPDKEIDGMFAEQSRKPNLNMEIINQISEKTGLSFTPEKEETENTFAPIDILDYIYAVLYSPTYREKYKEFLKIDFPRIPYPKDQKTFWQFVELGVQLTIIHLLESPVVSQFITRYPINGDNYVSRRIGVKDFEITDHANKLGRVWINDTQYFEGVPKVAWDFYIGGYQPAQKWLKVRKGRQLSFDDIMHYQKIIVALTETDRIMKEIDKIEVE